MGVTVVKVCFVTENLLCSTVFLKKHWAYWETIGRNVKKQREGEWRDLEEEKVNKEKMRIRRGGWGKKKKRKKVGIIRVKYEKRRKKRRERGDIKDEKVGTGWEWEELNETK